mmetsp:Transcript_40032/g.119234  ORF Transcript_40032/g.119234 Transcript_40032/m.119234 type:complete len:351 (-) Transcript_40032:1752-2804(-)
MPAKWARILHSRRADRDVVPDVLGVQKRAPYLNSRRAHGDDVPDVLCVLADGAVRRELARASRVHDRAARPLGLVLVHLVHLLLGGQVLSEVIGHQEPVIANVHVVDAVHHGLEVLSVAKHAALNILHDLVPARLRLEVLALLAKLVDLLGADAKHKDLLDASLLGNLDVCTVPGAQDQAAIHLELHVGCTRCLGAGGRDVLRHLRCRDDSLSKRHIVVGQEVKTQVLVSLRVVVDLLTNRGRQADDAFSHVVCRRGLAADDAHSRSGLLALLWRHLLQLLVAPDDGQQVEVLALVLVDALDVDVEHGVEVDILTSALLDHRGQLLLACHLDVLPLLLEGCILGKLAQFG